ncbi:MAG TPA: alpha-2-macroglobulin family protein [Anaerolineaceae bacterium]
MSRKLWFGLISILVVIILTVGLGGLTYYVANLPKFVSAHETIVLGQSRLSPGAQAALRVVVRDSKDGSTLSNASVKVSLAPASGGKPALLFEGKTDFGGTANVTYKIPENAEANQRLIIETTSTLGSDKMEKTVTVDRSYRVLLTTDKPLYQPGQVIHLRALALDTFSLRPAVGKDLEFIIADGKGNKVFRKTVKTGDYGSASIDFQLASEVNTGAYKITAVLDKISSEKTVNVEYYVLPKFAVTLKTDRAYYLPGEHAKGSLKSDYFFGKPVAGGKVQIEGFTYDVQRNTAFKLEGKTGTDGSYNFEFDLPRYIAGSTLDAGAGRFYLQATVTDATGHDETSNLSLPVSQTRLQVQALPEGGLFRRGLENIVYVMTSYPDGSPAQANLLVTLNNTGKTLTAQTGKYGLAEVRITPEQYGQVTIKATDSSGNTVSKTINMEGAYTTNSVILRPDRPAYRVGEVMKLSAFTTLKQGTVYLDIVRQGQTVSTRAEAVKNPTEFNIDLSPDLYGTLTLHAYTLQPDGNIVRDTRLVVVDAANDLTITMQPGKDTYRPGDTAGLDVQVSGSDGKGAASLLGLAIVDESVFALAEQDPGFAKLYFMLEAQLLQPKYDLHGYTLPGLASPKPGDDPDIRAAAETAGKASLSAATPKSISFSLQGNSHQEALQKTYNTRAQYFTILSYTFFGAEMLIPLAMIALSCYALARQRNLGRGLLLAGAILLAFAFLIGIPLLLSVLQGEVDDFFSFLFADLLNSEGSLVLGACLGIFGLAGMIALIIWTFLRRDWTLGITLLLTFAFPVVLGLMVFTQANANSDFSEGYIILILVAMLLVPLAYLIRGSGYAWQKRAVPGVASFAASLAVLPLLLIIAALFSSFGGMRTINVPDRDGIAPPMVLPGAPMPMAAPQPTAQAAERKAETEKGTGGADAASQVEAPRLRQFFPETMLWLPDAKTDAAGKLHLDIPVADSITTWRMTALASTQDGRIGSTQAPLRVFQDFFIDLDLPLSLTVGDEVAVPVGVFNYLPQAQKVRLELAKADWFTLTGESVKEIEIASNDIGVVYFRVRAEKFGVQPFKVTAIGTQMSDAIQKDVRVFPNGKELTFTRSDRLTPGTPVRQAVQIPPAAIPGTQKLVVKIYPGILSQVVEGLDKMLRMPSGCFEQTSSTTYPNVLVLDYLKSTNQISPESQMKAEQYINLGYQRLTTFEVRGGGFSLFGQPPADRMLTAYGLMEFTDMSRVYNVDPALIRRTADWLLAQQTKDGSWENDRGMYHEAGTWQKLKNTRIPTTAYIVWSLVEAEMGKDARTQKGLDYLRENQKDAEDSYVLALLANALVSADMKLNNGKLTSTTEAVLDRLSAKAVRQGNIVVWTSDIATFIGSKGETGSIETTSLAALALLRADKQPELANAALLGLVQKKDSFGTWYSTQATIMSLKALIQSVRTGAETIDAKATITLNGSQAKTIAVNKSNFDVVQLLSFDDVNPGAENIIGISMEGKGGLMYQVTGSYYLPWDQLPQKGDAKAPQEMVTISVKYDRTELATNDTVQVNVTVSLNQPGRADWALIDLGVPPGFTVLTEDLNVLVDKYKAMPKDYKGATIQRYELTGRQILVYIGSLSEGNPLSFSYRMKAKFPLVAQSPASTVYDYYNPSVSGEASPTKITVR